MSKPAKTLEKIYNPKSFEERLYQAWEAAGAFKPTGRGRKEDAWTLMMPPPNVTGRLHMGHALNMTLQDIMVRFKRMEGKDVFWQAGTDHAGIATQAVVERELARVSNQTRKELGREKFEARVWAWKEESGDAIVHQLKRLGASCDWTQSRFTLDEGMSHAVRTAFVKLYEDKLIYRAQRLVNWDIKLKTAISDLEVVQKEVQGNLWHLRYPLAEGEGVIVVATTRPETMLGDCAVAVHPDDKRYKSLIGKQVRLPLTNRLIPIVADSYADPKQGSGAVKITPAHDFNDFEVGARHQLEPINILDEGGAVLTTDIIPAAYRGLSREAARKQVVADLEAEGLLEKIEPITHAVPYGDRSNEVIEPYLTWQWFVDAKPLAEKALKAVKKNETTFIPDYWKKTYFEWLENIQPWCISRQLWWGHRIPAWFDEEGKIYVAMNEAEAKAQAGGKTLRQEEDVLDTWFSSGLWPFSTLGWENGSGDNDKLERYFPTALLITGLDIIFFWVARMMMFACYFMGEVPFKQVYIHALVRDAHGQKMTKSKGNVIDPLALMDKYGADALRFTMAAMAVQGQDLKLSEKRIEGYRNFATKLWNVARFCEMNECVYDKNFSPEKVQDPINYWIIERLHDATKQVRKSLNDYQFNGAANSIYHFVWDEFCDWYIEFVKVNLADDNKAQETQQTLAFVLRETLKLLHPFMPFITEELWQGQNEETLLINDTDDSFRNFEEQLPENPLDRLTEILILQKDIEQLRYFRELLQVPPATELEGFYEREMPSFYHPHIHRLARVIIKDGSPPPNIIRMPLSYLFLVLPDSVDTQSLKKEVEKVEKEIKKIEAKLQQKDFVEKAPPEVIKTNRQRLQEYQQTNKNLKEVLAALSA